MAGTSVSGLGCLTKTLFELADLFQALVTAAFTFRLGERGRRWGRGRGRRFQPHAADVEVFLEAIGLEQVGELEGADVAAAFADFALQVSR